MCIAALGCKSLDNVVGMPKELSVAVIYIKAAVVCTTAEV